MLVANEVFTDINRNMNRQFETAAARWQLRRREWSASLPVVHAARAEPSAGSPSHADTAHAFISPDHVARPKRMTIVKSEVEFIGNVFCPDGIETNTSAKRVQIVDGANPRRRRPLHKDFAGLTHLGPGRAWSINQHVGTPQIHPNMLSNLYKLDKMKPV
jgi:hypothetical protein